MESTRIELNLIKLNWNSTELKFNWTEIQLNWMNLNWVVIGNESSGMEWGWVDVELMSSWCWIGEKSVCVCVCVCVWFTRVDEVTVLTDDSDSFDSDPGELLRFFRTFLGRPFHLGAAIHKCTIQRLQLTHSSIPEPPTTPRATTTQTRPSTDRDGCRAAGGPPVRGNRTCPCRRRRGCWATGPGGRRWPGRRPASCTAPRIAPAASAPIGSGSRPGNSAPSPAAPTGCPGRPRPRLPITVKSYWEPITSSPIVSHRLLSSPIVSYRFPCGWREVMGGDGRWWEVARWRRPWIHLAHLPIAKCGAVSQSVVKNVNQQNIDRLQRCNSNEPTTRSSGIQLKLWINSPMRFNLEIGLVQLFSPAHLILTIKISIHSPWN